MTIRTMTGAASRRLMTATAGGAERPVAVPVVDPRRTRRRQQAETCKKRRESTNGRRHERRRCPMTNARPDSNVRDRPLAGSSGGPNFSRNQDERNDGGEPAGRPRSTIDLEFRRVRFIRNSPLASPGLRDADGDDETTRRRRSRSTVVSSSEGCRSCLPSVSRSWRSPPSPSPV